MAELRSKLSIVGFVALVGSLASCAAETDRAEEVEPLWSAPPLARAVTVCDGRTGERLELEELLDALAAADVVFLGEQHTDETTHRVELAVYEGLLERRGGDVVLAVEMFERDVQGTLDRYLAGELDEESFLAAARPWTNYGTGYRRLIERARASGAPVVASNFPAPLRRRMMTGGEGVLEALEGEERSWAPRELLANTPAYWRRVDNAVRGHIGMMGGPQDPDDPRLGSTQSLWDNSMGEACALALDAHPGSLVLHVNGGFHSSYWDGTTRQLQLRRPDASVKTVSIVPVANPALHEPLGLPVADYVVYAARQAADVESGRWSVFAQQELRYRLHVPESATHEAPAPLLIWLGEDGLTARDGLRLWRDRLGDEVAIAVLEPPYRAVSEDLGEGGRWFWADSFPEDIGLLITAVERAWGYLLRNFPLDDGRVALAGEGTGATVVAAVSLLSDMPVEARAFAPRRFAKIKDFPLPLPELRGELPAPDKRLFVQVREPDREWWSAELEEYTGIGFENRLEEEPASPWTRELEQENALRDALGLAQRSSGAPEGREALAVRTDTVRARHWARLYALRASKESGVQVAVVDSGAAAADARLIDAGVSPASFREGRSLPRCPGPFGGTTVLVLPDGIGEDEASEWFALEEDDPLNARNRFLRLRIARAKGEPALSAVLETLRSENRNNVLIVPAEFCADGPTMRALARDVRELEDSMTVHWLPGLGGQ